MKNKTIITLVLLLLMSTFFMPLSAFAMTKGEDSTEETPLPILEEKEAEVEEKEEEPTSLEPPPADSSTGNPFTPDGTATVVDNATGEDGKEFFTFSTDEGNVFFLIIDRSRSFDNVYFLNAVTERDLMALAERSEEDTTFSPIPPPLPTPESEDELPEEPEPPIESESQSTNNGTIIFIVIAALAFGGAAYYLKIFRLKKQGSAFDEEDEYAEHEDLEDEMEFLDEDDLEDVDYLDDEEDDLRAEDKEEERLIDEIY